MRKPRPLTSEDIHIWNRVARTVRPLISHPQSMSALLGETKGDAAKPRNGSYIHLPPAPKPVLHKTPSDLQTRSDKKIRKGKIGIDKKIDLHDLTRDEAFPVLVRRLIRAHNGGARCVLVVTGKGLQGQGVLKMSLPTWLADNRLRPIIGSFAPAHIRHGGSGAFYVFLKRKQGSIEI